MAASSIVAAMYARDAASAASGKQDGAVLEVALTLDDALLAGAEAGPPGVFAFYFSESSP